jgi:DNA-binding ferritin-like protein
MFVPSANHAGKVDRRPKLAGAVFAVWHAEGRALTRRHVRCIARHLVEPKRGAESRGAVMRVTARIEGGRSKEIAKGLSELLSQTRALRLETSDLERRLTGRTCSTLRLVLGQHRHELHRAEVELASHTTRVVGRTRRVGRFPQALGSAARQRSTLRVDERATRLMEAHEAASVLARHVGLKAEEAGDHPTYQLMIRRWAAHDEAAWTLAPLILSSVVSCDVCPAHSTCSLSAVVAPSSMSTTLEQRIVELSEPHVWPRPS